MSAPLAISLNLQLKGVHSSVRLASQIVLGLELDHLKRSLNYVGMGSWQAIRNDADAKGRPTWPAFCRAEAGISDRSAQNYLECGEAVKNRLSVVADRWKPGRRILKQMGKRPSDLTADERAELIKSIADRIIDSPASNLLKEYHAVKACGVSDSMPVKEAKVKKMRAMLKVMTDELKERDELKELKERDGLTLAALALRVLSQGIASEGREQFLARLKGGTNS